MILACSVRFEPKLNKRNGAGQFGIHSVTGNILYCEPNWLMIRKGGEMDCWYDFIWNFDARRPRNGRDDAKVTVKVFPSMHFFRSMSKAKCLFRTRLMASDKYENYCVAELPKWFHEWIGEKPINENNPCKRRWTSCRRDASLPSNSRLSIMSWFLVVAEELWVPVSRKPWSPMWLFNCELWKNSSRRPLLQY